MSKKFAYSDEEGKFLVKLARKSLTSYLKDGTTVSVPSDAPESLKKKSGVFVTLNIYSDKKENLDLRGCIGRPYPRQSLLTATIDSAIDSGINDYRFPNVRLKDLDNIVFEVTALTPPVEITAKTPEDRLNNIEIGIDGLILERNNAPPGYGGLFLPQVPVEWHWNKEEYLTHLCGKARMSSDMWRKVDQTNLYKFQGEIFHIAISARDLHRIGGHLHGCIRCHKFGHGAVFRDKLPILSIQVSGGLIGQKAGSLRTGHHIRQHELNGLKR